MMMMMMMITPAHTACQHAIKSKQCVCHQIHTRYVCGISATLSQHLLQNFRSVCNPHSLLPHKRANSPRDEVEQTSTKLTNRFAKQQRWQPFDGSRDRSVLANITYSWSEFSVERLNIWVEARSCKSLCKTNPNPTPIDLNSHPRIFRRLAENFDAYSVGKLDYSRLLSQSAITLIEITATGVSIGRHSLQPAVSGQVR